MQKWNKTTMIWNCGLGLETDILVDDWCRKEETHVHKIHGFRVTQLPDKKILMQLNIQRVSICPTTKRDEIRNRLLGLSTSDRPVYLSDTLNDRKFTLTFGLLRGEPFCMSAIDMVCKIFEVFGVDDKKGYRVADFIIIQETQIKLKDKWIPFADFLRHKRGLPQACGLYGRQLNIDGLVISVDYKEAASNFFLK